MKSALDLAKEMSQNRTRYQVLGLAFVLYFIFGFFCIYFFQAKEDMLFRAVFALMGIFYIARVSFFKTINYDFLEKTLPVFVPLINLGMVYIGSMNNYHFIYVTGCYTLPAATILFVNRTWHFLLSAILMLVSVPIFAMIYQVPRDVYVSMILQMLVFLSLMGLMLNQRLQSQSKLFNTLEKLGESERSRQESSKMAALGEMAGGVAHEINNPVAIIQGQAGMIQRALGAHPINEEKIFKSSEKIIDTVQRIGRITKGLLVYSRSGEEDPFTEVNLSAVIENTVEMIREKFRINKIDLRLKIPSELKADARETQISQLVMNLLANAIDAVNDIFPEALPTNVGAVSEEGLIDSNLSLVNPNKWIELDLSIQASTVVLSVTDCGSGISETTATKMFQPFFSTKEVGKGTGMGLAAAQGIALQHHGLLKYEKRNGHTCFVYTMPLAQEESVKSAFKSKAVVDPDSNAFSGRPGGGAAA